ncbi:MULTISPECIES: BppU family phage baseplate upper protein [Bacillus cereus group]|uniref:BppU family phage baseplate upper protein n=1 Tax=Bacillus cereus group TaxID=86661 RepID=UPI001F172710|nr:MULTISPECIES: BppU family phage baseplate upper protein [Bacillus cereus group]MED2903810.1 BppU family phage baseplate upper protein [Bacillus tropicus]
MNNQSYEITVDTQKSINHSNIEFSQNNLNISELIFNITEDGKELPLNDTDEIIVYFKKPDKTVVFQDKEIKLLDKTKGKIKVLLTTQTLVRAGDVEGEISIGRVENGMKKRTSTYGFSFKVRSSLASNDSIESTNEFQMFDQLLELGKQDIPAIIASKETSEQALKKSEDNEKQIGILSGYSEIVNVTMFGAKGGKENDAVALTDAVNYAIENNKTTIYVPFSQLTISPSVDLKGLIIKGNKTELSLGSIKNAQKVINCIINGVNSLDEPVFTPPMVGGVSPKVMVRVSDKVYRLITRKASGRGYISYLIERGIGTTTNSIGAPFDLRRVTLVQNFTDAWVYKRTRSSFEGNWQDYAFASEVGRALRYWRLQSVTGNEFIEFDVEVDETGKFTMAFYSTPSADNKAPITVDGVEIARVDLTRNPNNYFTETFTAKTGKRKVRIGFSGSGAVGRYMMVAGVNFYKLENADITKEYDYYSYWSNTDDYIYNKGALDYAMVDNDTGQYCGSYHGGETLVREELRMDSKALTLADNEFKVGKLVELNQTTKIVDKLVSETIQRFNEDGVFDFLCNMSGDMTVSTFYNCMTTTSDAFTQLVYPKRMDINVAQDYTIGRSNVLIQENPVTKQRISTYMTIFNNDNNRNGGTIIRRSVGGYNKIYYGKYVYSLGKVEDLNFRTVRIFE